MDTLLDLFCGAGGAAQGYADAGFTHIVGIDTCPQPNYPFDFIQADALEYVKAHGKDFDLIHASPPCQAYTVINAVWKRKYPELIMQTRQELQKTLKPYVIENVPQAPLQNVIVLCGTMFGLFVVRHRKFEISPVLPILTPPCQHERRVVKHGRRPDRGKHYASVTGHFSDIKFSQKAMGINWMTQRELSQAIPPAYTQFIGMQMIKITNSLKKRPFPIDKKWQRNYCIL